MSHEKLVEYSKNLAGFIAQAKEITGESAELSGGDGQWSPSYVLHHVADAEMHFATRYFNALVIDKPPIIPFNEDEYPNLLNYAGRDWTNSLALVVSIGALVQVTLSPITSQQWERTSIHPEMGEVSISTLIGKASNHMIAHTEQLKDLI